MRLSKTLVLVADRKMAKFYSYEDHQIQNVLKSITADKWWKIFTKEGQNNFFHKLSNPSHFFDPHHDAKENERRKFAVEVTKTLKEVLKTYPASSIILFSDPKMIGELRKNLDPRIQSLIHQEFHKDITHYNPREITECLARA